MLRTSQGNSLKSTRKGAPYPLPTKENVGMGPMSVLPEWGWWVGVRVGLQPNQILVPERARLAYE